MSTRTENASLLMTVLWVCFFSLSSSAQENTVAISLETVLQIGGANNLTIQDFEQRQQLAESDLSIAREWWLPDVYAGFGIHQLWGSAMNTDGTFITDFYRDNFQAGLSLQAIWDFGEGVYNAEAAGLRAQASTYRTQAERNQALLRSINAYYELLAAQLQYLAYGQLVAQADTIARQVEAQVEAGLRYESEMLLYQSNHRHLRIEMLNARADYASASARLVNLLNLDPQMQLVVSDSVIAPLDLMPEESPVPFDSAYQKRPELKELELMLQSLHREKKTVTTGLLFPELHVGTRGSYFGDVVSPLNPTGEVNAAVLWRIPLGQLFYGGEVKQFDSRISIEQTKMAQLRGQVNEEVMEARAVIMNAKEQMEIAEEGSRLAEQALRQSMQRQELGTVRPFEILQAQEIYLKTKLDYLKAVSSYNKAQYAWYVATGNDL